MPNVRSRRAAILRTLPVLGLLLLLLARAASAAAAPGDIDPTFDGDGKKILANIGLDYAEAVLVQPDGKIVVAGYPSSGEQDFTVARLNGDGSADNGFGGNGVNVAGFGDQGIALAAALQPDDKVVVVGYAVVGNNRNAAVARFNPDGSLDATFDPGGADGPGKRIIDYGGVDAAADVLVQPDGRIVLAGYGGANTDLAVTRLNSNGSDDTSFDGDGTAGADFGGSQHGYGVALQPDGKIVIAGDTSPGDVAVARFNPIGPANLTLDDTFDGDGKRTIDYAGSDTGRAVLVQPDGKLLVAGDGGSNSALAATRLNPDGSFDPGFDADGTSGADFGGAEEGYAALLQQNGKIVLVGLTSVGQDIAMARLQPGGALDTTFSFDGKTTVNVGGNDQGYAAALQADGKIVIAGYTSGGAAVVRVEGDPPPEGAAGGAPGGAAEGGAATPRCAGRAATMVGTVGPDRLRGTPRADVIVALAGNDTVSGGGGADLICGRRGDDKLSGGRGPDRLHGERGKDALYGGRGTDLLKGGPGDDRLAGGSDRDRCPGGPGHDGARTCER